MLDMKVTGLTLRAVSITYATTVGKVDAWCTMDQYVSTRNTIEVRAKAQTSNCDTAK